MPGSGQAKCYYWCCQIDREGGTWESCTTEVVAAGGAFASVTGRAAELACRAGRAAVLWRAEACCNVASSFRKVLLAFLLTTCGHLSEATPRSASARRVRSTLRKRCGVHGSASLNLDAVTLYDARRSSVSRNACGSR